MAIRVKTTADSTLGVVSKNVEDGSECLSVEQPLTASNGLNISAGGIYVVGDTWLRADGTFRIDIPMTASHGILTTVQPITASAGIQVYGSASIFQTGVTASAGLFAGGDMLTASKGVFVYGAPSNFQTTVTAAAGFFAGGDMLTASKGMFVYGNNSEFRNPVTAAVGFKAAGDMLTASSGMLVYGNGSDFRNPTTASAGFKVNESYSNVGFAPYAVQAATSLATAPVTAVQSGSAGVFLIGVPGATTAVTAHLPAAANYGGSIFTIRSITAGAHVISGSDHQYGLSPAKIFSDCLGAVAFSGSTITFPVYSGSSVVLLCDGKNYVVIGKSGSMTYA